MALDAQWMLTFYRYWRRYHRVHLQQSDWWLFVERICDPVDGPQSLKMLSILKHLKRRGI